MSLKFRKDYKTSYKKISKYNKYESILIYINNNNNNNIFCDFLLIVFNDDAQEKI